MPRPPRSRSPTIRGRDRAAARTGGPNYSPTSGNPARARRLGTPERYSFRRYWIFRIETPSTSAARAVEPPHWSSVRRIASRSISKSVAPGMRAEAVLSSGRPPWRTGVRSSAVISRPRHEAVLDPSHPVDAQPPVPADKEAWPVVPVRAEVVVVGGGVAGIQSALDLANTGCYAAGAILATAPLLKSGFGRTEGIVIDGKSGVTGAGLPFSLRPKPSR